MAHMGGDRRGRFPAGMGTTCNSELQIGTQSKAQPQGVAVILTQTHHIKYLIRIRSHRRFPPGQTASAACCLTKCTAAFPNVQRPLEVI